MNLLLLNNNELHSPLSRGDVRYDHVKKILKSLPGDFLEGGVINGCLGKIRIDSLDDQSVHFSFFPSSLKPIPLAPLTMIIGCPRPPTARRMIKDLTTLGVGRLIFIDTDLNEKSYLRAKLWREELYETALLEGAMQGKSPLLPQVDRYYSLKAALQSLKGREYRLVPDLTEAVNLLEGLNDVKAYKETVLAIGPERGWTSGERAVLRESGFLSVSMGNRVMRTETAASLAAGMVILKMIQS